MQVRMLGPPPSRVFLLSSNAHVQGTSSSAMVSPTHAARFCTSAHHVLDIFLAAFNFPRCYDDAL